MYQLITDIAYFGGLKSMNGTYQGAKAKRLQEPEALNCQPREPISHTLNTWARVKTPSRAPYPFTNLIVLPVYCCVALCMQRAAPSI